MALSLNLVCDIVLRVRESHKSLHPVEYQIYTNLIISIGKNTRWHFRTLLLQTGIGVACRSSDTHGTNTADEG